LLISFKSTPLLLEAGMGVWHSAASNLGGTMSEDVTKREMMVVIETMNDKFQQVLECFTIHSKEIADLKTELKEDIALVDAKVMGLSKRVDSVEKNLNDKIDSVEKNLNDKIDSVEKSLNDKIDSVEKNLNTKINSVEKNLNTKINSVEKRLSSEITEVRDDLRAHRESVELHAVPKRRALKKVG
jgi:DNA anti-recombination protein RmuC